MKLADYDCECGKLMLGVHGNAICLCDWATGDRVDRTLGRINRFLPQTSVADDSALLDKTKRRLDKYFAGTLKSFDVEILALGTEFQRRVWQTLRNVPYGETVTYKHIAEAICLPSGVRAVAAAIGANPLSILIPCHRIIGKDGNLTGYAGGLEAKRYLLRLEARYLPQ